MISNSGFTDLRMSHAHGMANDDSVWPSFTDIMTVIVMVFLMALVIILIRNVDLVQQLRATMQSEQQVAELARTREQQRRALETELEQTRTELATTRGELDTTLTRLSAVTSERDQGIEERERMDTRIAELSRDIGALESLRQRLEEQQAAAESENIELSATVATLESRLRESAAERDTLSTDLAELQELRNRLAAQLAEALVSVENLQAEAVEGEQRRAQLAGRVDELDRERADLLRNQAELSDQRADLRSQVEQLGERLAQVELARLAAENLGESLGEELDEVSSRYALSLEQLALIRNDLLQREQDLEESRRQVLALKGDYVDLEDKYNKLVRPARSPVGRHVVEVRYTKSSGVNLYQIREPGQSEYRNVSLEQLRARLDELKQREAENLYTRIIIPDDSGLSYNEAWEFTNSILINYDYYHQ